MADWDTGRDLDPPSWTVYGRRRTGRISADGKVITAGVHADRLATRDEAVSWLMTQCMNHGPHNIDAVVVKLDHGADVNGERHVIERVGQGRAWWE